MRACIIPLTQTAAVGATSAVVATALLPNVVYAISSTVACWVAQGANPTAVAHTTPSMYLAPGVERLLAGEEGVKLAAIQDSTGGYISVTPVI